MPHTTLPGRVLATRVHGAGDGEKQGVVGARRETHDPTSRTLGRQGGHQSGCEGVTAALPCADIRRGAGVLVAPPRQRLHVVRYTGRFRGSHEPQLPLRPPPPGKRVPVS